MPDTGYATYKISVCLKKCGRRRIISGYSGKITYSTLGPMFTLSLHQKRISDGLIATERKRLKKYRDKHRTKDRDNWRGT